MDGDTLKHHGILGMKWGKRNGPPYPLNDTKSENNSKKGSSDNHDKDKPEDKKKTTKSKPIGELSDQELREKISRLELEKRYKDLMKERTPVKSDKGKKFVMDVLEKSGKNVATQLTTYALGMAVNKALANIFNDPAVVNPKKGQKDK